MRSKPEALEMSALIGTLLWTGASLEQALSLQVLLGGTPAPDCDLALRISAIRCKNQFSLAQDVQTKCPIGRCRHDLPNGRSKSVVVKP
jgi:hypothetical protein